ncbi:DeoR/GlpR family DNA-binding transcription regulator [Kitasatospora sp. NBC_00240]|uniref:DeoR/GlpR family DNA-binding transcription regulator n=1 Tax=Kitasatospora sp. NBC_00240 TaxID=2903567 RepID=UPI00225C27DB|nr:DeoR/GlpR family DNA-binding transcription regulator [Kitasatospora sp. NBC_00240]MCX5214739.1 DeoR/GlpR family DNA-binding transcription regulator [Kitasatospora sp. NBC_00240]
MTVRRDPDGFARIRRARTAAGGVVAVPDDEPGFEARAARRSAEKDAVAEVAASLVVPGTVVALSAGTTTYAVARRLLDVPDLTVVTNSLPIAALLRATAEERGPRTPSLLLTGGSSTRSAALVGPIADQAVRGLHVDLLILGAHGVSNRAGLTTPDLAEAQTNRALIASARRVAVVADHSKWGVVGLGGFARLDEIGLLITDDRLDPQVQNLLRAAVGELIVAGARDS